MYYIDSTIKQKRTINGKVETMRTINLIPSDCDCDPRQALGYCWADIDNRIPGEDIEVNAVDYKAGIDNCLDMLEAEYGLIAIRDNDTYGWLRSTATTRAGRTINIDNVKPIATVSGMWCGGINVTVFPVPENAKTVGSPAKSSQAGGDLAETATLERTAEKIEIAELDERCKNYPGWCTKCHSFCYGDCDI